MDYHSYQKARDLTWELLLRNRVSALPVRISELCAAEGISIRLFSPCKESDGKSLILNGQPYILVSRAVPPERQRFTAAHELGHVLLGHVGRYQLVNREPSPGDNPIEREANVFASRLLAPACVLWGCRLHTPDEIMDLCRISRQAAEYRAARMEQLYRREKFLTSPLERQVYEQFLPFINVHRL